MYVVLPYADFIYMKSIDFLSDCYGIIEYIPILNIQYNTLYKITHNINEY